MAKRFTDSDKWVKKPWFRTLKPATKLFWLYLLDSCDQAGIWEVDFGLASLLIGIEINEEEVKDSLKKQFLEIRGGRKWFIPDFINFQYGELRENNRMHGFVSNLLKKEGVSIPLNHVSEGAKDKVKDMDKVSKEGCGEEGLVLLSTAEREKLTEKMGSKKAADYIQKLENYIGSKGRQYRSHYHTILSWWQKDGKPRDPVKQEDTAEKIKQWEKEASPMPDECKKLMEKFKIKSAVPNGS